MKDKFLNYFKNYGFNSIIVLNSLKIFIIFIIITAIPITIAYSLFLNSLSENNVTENRIETQKVMMVFETYFRDAEYLSAEMLAEDVIIEFLSMRENSTVDENFTKKLTETLATYSKGRSEMTPLYIYNEKNNLISTVDGIMPAKKINPVWLADYKEGFSGGYKIVPKRSNQGYVRSFSLVKKSPILNGSVIVEIDAMEIKKKMQGLLSASSDVYIFMDGYVVYQSTREVPELVKEFVQNSENYRKKYGLFQNSLNSSYYNFKYVVTTGTQQFTQQLKNIYFVFICMLFVFLTVAISLSVFLSMNSLGYVMGFIDLLDTKRRPKVLKDNEVKYVTDKILHIIDDNDKLKSEIENRMVMFDEMKRKALQAQISPHFLNNSLSAVNYNLLTECGYGTVTADMLSKLSRIVEYSYITDDILVCLSSELQFINDYIDFLKMRYGEFASEVIADGTILNIKIPKMTIQPFVENAVMHGFGKKDNMIKINCCDKGESFVIVIYDNGVGMTEETLENLKEDIKNENFSEKNIGIKNVCGRVRLMYSDNADIKIESAYKEYTRITIEIMK